MHGGAPMRSLCVAILCLLTPAVAQAVPLSISFSGVYGDLNDALGVADSTAFTGTVTAEDIAEGRNSLFTAIVTFGAYIVTGVGTVGFAPAENSVAGLVLEAALRNTDTIDLAFTDDLVLRFNADGTAGTVHWNGTAFPASGPIDYGVTGLITEVATPEPSALVLLVCAAPMLCARRRHWFKGCG